MRSYDDVLLVVNNNSQMSKDIGNYFKAQRGIPESRICYINTVTSESCSSTEFVNNIKIPIQNFLINNNLTYIINFIVITKGTPLRANVSITSGLVNLFIGGSPTGWVNNPYFGKNEPFSSAKYNRYLVTRLDGYTYEDIVKLIDNSTIASSTNADFVNGKFILDIVGFTGAYQQFDDRMRAAAVILRNKGFNVLDDVATKYSYQTNVLASYSWGSHGGVLKQNNTWLPGAITDVADSYSGVSFIGPPVYGQSWTADLIQEGTTGAVGNTYEPYLESVTYPNISLDRYTEGFTLAESYYMATPYVNWANTVVGDPKTIIKQTLTYPINCNFTISGIIQIDQNITFTAQDLYLSSYKWFINNIEQPETTTSIIRFFNTLGTYDIKLDVIDVYGTTCTKTNTITIIYPPINCNFTIPSSPTYIDTNITFTASSNVQISNYKWFINNIEQIETTSSITKIFNQIGTYDIRIEETDVYNQVCSINKIIIIEYPPFNCNFTISEPIQINQNLIFTAANLYLSSYKWFINNIEQAETITSITKFFDTLGTYDIRLEGTDAYNNTCSTTQTITICNPNVNCEFVISGLLKINQNITFTSTDINLTNRKWYINNALQQETTRSINIIFTNSGIYTIKLATDCSQIGSTSKIIFICNEPICDFIISGIQQINQNITFISTGTELRTHIWKINGTEVYRSSTSSYTTTFTEVGTYIIQHDSNNGCGLTCSTTQNISISTLDCQIPVCDYIITLQ